MKAHDLQQVRPGFHDPATGSQAVFRSALSALSHPGRVIEMPEVSEHPRHGHSAAAVLLQALVDSDCNVWLSPTLAGTDAAAWLAVSHRLPLGRVGRHGPLPVGGQWRRIARAGHAGRQAPTSTRTSPQPA